MSEGGSVGGPRHSMIAGGGVAWLGRPGQAPFGVDQRASTVDSARATAAEIAVLDRFGVIVPVNEAWVDFCRDTGGDPAHCGVGVPYLAVRQDEGQDEVAAQVASAIRSAVVGDLPGPLIIRAPSAARGGRCWFDTLISSRFDLDGACIGATVALCVQRGIFGYEPSIRIGGLDR